MNPVTDLAEAWRGLGMTVAGKREAAGHFNPTLGGLVVALGWLLFALILSAAAQSMAVGMPSVMQVVIGLVIQGITTTVLAVATILTLSFLKLDVPVLGLFVPMVYFMALMQVFAVPLILLGPNVQILAVIVLAVLIWRAGMVLAGMRNSVAIAFSLLCLMVLVVAPNALYMLFLAIPSPA